MPVVAVMLLWDRIYLWWFYYCIKKKKTIFVIMETLNILDTLELSAISRESKLYRKRVNPFSEYTEEDFRKKYRFSKNNCKKLIRLVQADLQRSSKRNGGSIPPYIQVLAAIRCWGRNNIQDDCAEYHGFSQSTMSRICSKVAQAFAKRAASIIKIATSTEEQIETMEKFKKIAGFKNIIGAIDCTHIRIQAAGGDDAQLFVNRKGYFSFNVQVVCDATLKITDIVACWRGSTHDSRIFNESKIRTKLEEGAFMGRLVGDGGYKCSNHLFTPVQNPKNIKEEMYNKVHIKTRNVVERLFGVWKSRFRILLGKMRISRENGKVLIVALAVLHNLSIIYNEPAFDDYEVQNLRSENATFYDDPENEDISRSIYIEKNF